MELVRSYRCDVDESYDPVPMADKGTYVVRCLLRNERDLQELKSRDGVVGVSKEGHAEHM